jgi:hypothetical protein
MNLAQVCERVSVSLKAEFGIEVEADEERGKEDEEQGYYHYG